ncbi:photosystem II biogenesis protein Psp29 [Rubidibacter lacunae]|uniref:photosystem II biogenesis protein Psp29 n=1 Tax=Rubidibacter lacunae TaxID=582514 RepID=UPI000425F52A|nr:photosystem II biogenesis protein Psp29 [Rubidibacter lacunae]
MNTIRTVSDTKRSFYTLHARPINSVYRRVVEELMVEMHLLSVNTDFRYDPLYALGITTAFDRFMLGYTPAEDKDSIFGAICRAVECDPQQVRSDADRARALTESTDGDAVSAWLRTERTFDGDDILNDLPGAIANNPRFKYSRLFAIGLYAFLTAADTALIEDEDRRRAALEQACEALSLPREKFEKDLDLYRSNLEKMEQARLAIEDALLSSRKQRERRQQERAAAESSGDTEASPVEEATDSSSEPSTS